MTRDLSSSPIYVEDQRFSQWWLWAILIGSAAFSGFIGWNALQSPAVSQTDRIAVICTVGFAAGLPLILIALCKLRIEVRRENVSVRFFPFHKAPKLYDTQEIASAKSTTYSPMMEYGGWGLRKNWSGDKIYNASGNRGVLLTFKNGTKLMLGSQKPDEMARAITENL